MTLRWRMALRWLAVLAAGTLLTVLFIAYQQPELLLDWVNLRYCG